MRAVVMFLCALLLAPCPAIALEAAVDFPRLGMWWPDNERQSVADRARYAFIGLQNADADQIAPLKAANPAMKILGTHSARELNYREGDYSHPLNIELRSASLTWALSQVGSALTAAIGPNDTVVPVWAVRKGSTTLFAPGDVFAIDNELFKVRSTSGTNLTVSRGMYMGTPPTAHAGGARVANVCMTWSGAISFDLTSACPKADVGHGPETWAQWNTRRFGDVLRGAAWDGIIIDCDEGEFSFWTRVSLSPPIRTIDTDRSNTVRTNYAAFDAAYKAGTLAYHTAIRALAGESIIIVNRGLDDFGTINGTIFEDFPNDSASESWWTQRIVGPSDSGWRPYLDWTTRGRDPAYTLIEVYEDDGKYLTPTYRRMRYGLTTALMGDGYFSYEMTNHGVGGLFWFDEYDNAGKGRGWLGTPISPPQRLANGVWCRSFTRGRAFVNPTSKPQSFDVRGKFVRIDGTQDRAVNNGQVARVITLPPRDGIVLVRR
jgi:hypothetical protein